MHVLAISPGTGFDAGRWARVLDAGVDGFMVRERGLEARALLEAALFVRDRAPGAVLWVNGRLDVALAAGCGCHVPEVHPEVPPGLVPLSRPVHEPAQLPGRWAAAQLVLSPIFPVPGKGPAWGAGRFRAVLDGLPGGGGRILALGGIRPDRLAALRHPRLDGVALLRGLWEVPDPARALRELRAAWGE
jgi:thiamine-phosphate pyrophosphorylase